MPGMHESTERLYLAMSELRKVKGPSAVAHVLGSTSPQTVKNWEVRGVSVEGALLAQAKAGIDANWLLSGDGGMTIDWPFKMVSPSRFFALKPDQRSFIEGQLAAAIAQCEKPPDPPPGRDADAHAEAARRALGRRSTTGQLKRR